MNRTTTLAIPFRVIIHDMSTDKRTIVYDAVLHVDDYQIDMETPEGVYVAGLGHELDITIPINPMVPLLTANETQKQEIFAKLAPFARVILAAENDDD